MSSFLMLISLLRLSIHARVADPSNASNSNNNHCFGHSLKVPSKSLKQHFVIAHRGASAHLPEHTLAAYQLALELGADFIEPDLVSTSDNQLMAMHTSDLNITSNVFEVFGDSREPWFSPFANRSSYWAFNFTADEIRQLRVKQRLPSARTSMYDGMFQIPMLNDILELLNVYNSNTLSQLVVTASATKDAKVDASNLRRVKLAQAGLYAELKDSVWLKEEANIDLVQLLLDHVQTNQESWDPLLKCQTGFKYDEYKVPGFIVQSFDPNALERLHDQWADTLTATYDYPMPPSILLVSAPDCWADDFWFQLGEHWRGYVDGLGPDKRCMLDDQTRQVFLEKAREFDMVLHPWTERPETIYLANGFDSILDETKHLYCMCGAQAVFSESVSTAVAAIALGCDDLIENGASPTVSSNDADSNKTLPVSATSVCVYDDIAASEIYLTASAFIGGIVATLLVSCLIRRRAVQKQQFLGRRRVPSYENELELT
ncbi:hypothetical protein MPSEU_000404100 [Mayamaea pseudoterrestris]|nr:hypothetical protein MPSEU_000404100 [Mayamaea pseudoterrestris]